MVLKELSFGMALFFCVYLQRSLKEMDKKPSPHLPELPALTHDIKSRLKNGTEGTSSSNRKTPKGTIFYCTEGVHTNKPSEAASERSRSNRSARTL